MIIDNDSNYYSVTEFKITLTSNFFTSFTALVELKGTKRTYNVVLRSSLNVYPTLG